MCYKRNRFSYIIKYEGGKKMPAWGVHLATAKNILEKVEIENKNDFIFGNILPDILNGYLIKDVSNIVTHREAHYDTYQKERFGSYKVFYEQYNQKLDNKVILGYLAHLMTDNLWNKEFYNKKAIFDNDEIVRTKSIKWRCKEK